MPGNSRGETLVFRIPKEVFDTGVADAHTFNKAMDWIDDLLRNLGANWKAPVAAPVNLPAGGNVDGDARVTISTAQIWIWRDALPGWVPVGGTGVYAGSFEQAVKPTVVQIPDGWWGYWWDTVNSSLWHVRNRGGAMYAVRLTPLP